MTFATFEQAESHERRARRERRRLVKIVDSLVKREAWRKKAKKAIEQLKEAGGS